LPMELAQAHKHLQEDVMRKVLRQVQVFHKRNAFVVDLLRIPVVEQPKVVGFFTDYNALDQFLVRERFPFPKSKQYCG